MVTIFQSKNFQENECMFRCEYFESNGGLLWIAESEEDIYIIEFKSILSACVYSANETLHKVVILYNDGEDNHTDGVGSFSTAEDASLFLMWLIKMCNLKSPKS